MYLHKYNDMKLFFYILKKKLERFWEETDPFQNSVQK